MEHLGTLLDALPLPPAAERDGRAVDASLGTFETMARRLGGDLPAGHLHVWGGPSGAGKTSLLLSLLHGAASRGRPVVYATYDLPPSSLAMRALAMLADVDVGRLPDPGGAPSSRLSPAQAARLASVRDELRALPVHVLPARGFSVASLADRVVRAPERAQVLVVDYVQAVIREPGTALGSTLRALSDLATHLHLAVVCVFRAEPVPTTEDANGETQDRADRPLLAEAEGVADRIGWIAPADGSGVRRAEILRNRYGERPSVPLELDAASGRLAPGDLSNGT